MPTVYFAVGIFYLYALIIVDNGRQKWYYRVIKDQIAFCVVYRSFGGTKMKKTVIFALTVIMLLSVCVIGLNVSGADYSSLLGEAPSDPQYKLDVSVDSKYKPGKEIKVTVGISNVKTPVDLLDFKLFYDKTKVEPIVKNDSKGNTQMEKFISKPALGTNEWEAINSLSEDRGCYNIGITDITGEAPITSGELQVDISFKVKDDAEGDIVFYVRHELNDNCANDGTLMPEGDFGGLGSYAVSTLQVDPVTAIGAKYNSDGDSLKFGTKFIKQDGKTVKELGMYVIFESDLGKKSATSSNIVKSSKAVKLKAEAIDSSDYVKYQSFEKYQSFVYTVTFDGLKGKTSKNIIAMPYVTYSDGETFYGDPITRSYDGVKAAG